MSSTSSKQKSKSFFQRKLFATTTGLFLAIGLFMAFNIIVNLGLPGLKIDLTEAKLYSLSDGTKNILSNLVEPVQLKFYASKDAIAENSTLSNYSNRVLDMLREYVDLADGQLSLEYIDPEPFSEAEDRAVAEGLKTIPLGRGGAQAYLGLVGVNSTDDRQVLPVLQAEREASLEYEITKLIYTLNYPKKPVVGIAGSIPVFGSETEEKSWQFIDSLRSLFEVRDLGETPVGLENLDVLALIHPKEFDDEAWYAVDQFLLNGGKLLAFIDPLSVYELANFKPEPNDASPPDMTSNLGPLLNNWGLQMVEGKVAGDKDGSMRVQHQGQRGVEQVYYLPWLSLTDKNLNQDDFATRDIKLVHVPAAGALQVLAEAEAEEGEVKLKPEAEALFSTSKNSMLLDYFSVLYQNNPHELLKLFESGDEVIDVAMRLSGMSTSAFAEPAGRGIGLEHIEQGQINAVIIADSDLLQDRFWVNVRRVFNLSIPNKFANNGDFVANVLENLSGNNDLISLRSRGSYARPFTRVEGLRREAEASWRDEEKRLKDKLAETEQRIQQLQQNNSESGQAILSTRRAEEIASFQRERIETRKKLRAVQLDLNKSIESLGTLLKFINIILIPFIVVLASLGFYFWRQRRRLTSKH